MAMQYDVKAGAAAAGTTTTVFNGPARIKGIVISHPSGGTITINDGPGGPVVFTFTALAVIGALNVVVPGEGIRCNTSISVTCGASLTATVFYG